MKKEDFVNITEESETMIAQLNQLQEAEYDAAQYSEDGTFLIKYEGNAESYAIREGTQDIGVNAFSGNDTLKTIHLPASVRNIWDHFNGCKNLVAIEVDKENPDFFSEDGILYWGTRGCGESLFRFPMAKVMDVLHIKASSIGKEAFYKCTGIREVFIEPENGGGIFIDSKAFAESSLRILYLRVSKGRSLFCHDIFDGCEDVFGECVVKVYAPIPRLITEQTYRLSKVWQDHFPEIQEEQYEVIQDEEGGIYSADGIRLVKYMGQSHIYKIKEGTKIINSTAFQDMRSLVSLTIPKSVQFIQKDAINGCVNLCHIYIEPGNVAGFKVEGNLLKDDDDNVIWKFNRGY